jgi:threonine aldolase
VPAVATHSFGSDNHSGVHPSVLAALAAANEGHAPAYGADAVTARATGLVREHLGGSAEVAFVFNGTGANLVGLGLALRPWQHVVCAATAHIAVDECGAPERLLGTKLVELRTPDGKLTPDLVRGSLSGVGDEHRTQPGAVSVTQSTELGTVYTPAEIRALADTAHELGMVLHLDGARLANAAASLGLPLAAVTTDCGVDVLSFGGTKNGLLGAEAVVVLRPELAPALAYLRKQLGQLGSKGRFLAAQFAALLEDDLWLRNAANANAMARRLEAGVRALPGVEVAWPVQANAVFVRLPAAMALASQSFGAYPPDEVTGLVRLMCSWDTTEAQVDALLAALDAAGEPAPVSATGSSTGQV